MTKIVLIGTIVVPTSIWSDQPVKLITLVGMNIVEHVIKPMKPMSKSLISFYIPTKLIHV